jgi:hypothetical protein
VVNDPLRKFWRQTLSSFSITSSFIFAIQVSSLFTVSSPAYQANAFPDYFFPMIAASLGIQYASQLVEGAVAQSKGIALSQVVLPSASSMFNFGQRSTFLTPPKNVKDMFDVVAAQSVSGLLLSIGAVLAGLQATAGASPEAIALYPTVPAALLKINTFVNQVLTSQLLPDLMKVRVTLRADI